MTAFWLPPCQHQQLGAPDELKKASNKRNNPLFDLRQSDAEINHLLQNSLGDSQDFNF